jgi:hypothetical protein
VADEPSVSEALRSWREAERWAIRATAQREAAEVAVEAATLAAAAARATADSAAAAQVAADEAAQAALATAEAADLVIKATQRDNDTARVTERDALATERAAHAAHKSAVERADRGYQDGG